MMSKGKRAILLFCVMTAVLSSCGTAPSVTIPPMTAPVQVTEASSEGTAEQQSEDPEETSDDDTYEADTADVQYSDNSALDGDDTEDNADETSAVSEESETEPDETELSEDEDVQAAEEESGTEETAEETEEAAETSEETAVTVSETSAETTSEAAAIETAAETATTAEITTTAEETTTAETTTTTAETTTTTAAPVTEPAAPSPPKISPVSSPGTSVLSFGNAAIDYSNAASGYVSVSYSGSTRIKMLLECGGVQYDYDIYAGTGAQYFTLSQGSGTYTADLYEMADNGKYLNLGKDSFTANISDTITMYTYTNQFINFNASSACVAKASEVCAGCTTNLEKISAIFKYVTDTVTYDKQLAATVTGGYIPDPDSVLAKKTGICFDYASLTAAMLRSQGVPTKLIVGYAYPEIYHAWNEVYTPESGWITIEIALSNSGFNRIDATFYASAADKQSFADYISQSGSYSGVYVY